MTIAVAEDLTVGVRVTMALLILVIICEAAASPFVGRSFSAVETALTIAVADARTMLVRDTIVLLISVIIWVVILTACVFAAVIAVVIPLPMLVIDAFMVPALDTIVLLMLVIICVTVLWDWVDIVFIVFCTFVLMVVIAEVTLPVLLWIALAMLFMAPDTSALFSPFTISAEMFCPTVVKSTASAAVRAFSIVLVMAVSRAVFCVTICAELSTAPDGAPMKFGSFHFSTALPVASSIFTPNTSRYSSSRSALPSISCMALVASGPSLANSSAAVGPSCRVISSIACSHSA